MACGLTDLNTWTFESEKDLYLSTPAIQSGGGNNENLLQHIRAGQVMRM